MPIWLLLKNNISNSIVFNSTESEFESKIAVFYESLHSMEIQCLLSEIENESQTA